MRSGFEKGKTFQLFAPRLLAPNIYSERKKFPNDAFVYPYGVGFDRSLITDEILSDARSLGAPIPRLDDRDREDDRFMFAVASSPVEVAENLGDYRKLIEIFAEADARNIPRDTLLHGVSCRLELNWFRHFNRYQTRYITSLAFSKVTLDAAELKIKMAARL